jgi:Calcineurin-like phosphoesterase
MLNNINIALSVPDTDNEDRYFYFKLQQDLYNEPSVYRQPSKIFVISDIEGNFQAFCRLLIRYKIIDKYFKWQFEEGHLVILGDCFDRGEQVTECLWLIYSLEHKARKKGGYVHFILGNHEIMNMNGDWRYMHPKYALATRNTKNPPTALYDASNELWRWLRTKNIIEKIGDTLFVHAGISAELMALDFSVEDINSHVRPYYTRAGESFSNPLLRVVFNSDQSPFWYRGYYQGIANDDQIDATLDKFGVTTIVTGHTVVEQIRSFYDGKVINTDTDHAAGSSEGLFIIKGKFYRVNVQGKKEKIK